ncbi:MAG TPA: hypothetical protein VHD62_15625 [Opitutaceae bacterium]|nr:hypothetical protein [Opitutaceae bacterium]
MKTENLEMLLLDRALGQLAPEVAEMVDEHLARDPAAARCAEEWAATLQLARATVAAENFQVGDSGAGLARVRRAWRWRSAGVEVMKLAACVALGLAAGWAMRAPRSMPAAITVAGPVRVRAMSPSPSPAAAFWIAARREAEANRRGGEASPRTTVDWGKIDRIGTTKDSR